MRTATVQFSESGFTEWPQPPHWIVFPVESLPNPSFTECLPNFHWKTPFFTEKCFVASPSQRSAPNFGAKGTNPETKERKRAQMSTKERRWAQKGTNPQKSAKESKRARFETTRFGNSQTVGCTLRGSCARKFFVESDLRRVLWRCIALGFNGSKASGKGSEKGGLRKGRLGGTLRSKFASKWGFRVETLIFLCFWGRALTRHGGLGFKTLKGGLTWICPKLGFRV